jgi:DnaJ-domain-containing protein 1
MTLDHATGDMDGLVLEGVFQGRLLSTLELDQLLALLQRFRDEDGQSAALLEAYLDRTRGEDWRESAPGVGGGSPQSSSPMNREEALAILGLRPGADDDAIREAHRRLIQRLHPDRGGSDYLAAKINEAKRFLLDE